MYRPQYGAANDNHDIVNGSVRNLVECLIFAELDEMMRMEDHFSIEPRTKWFHSFSYFLCFQMPHLTIWSYFFVPRREILSQRVFESLNPGFVDYVNQPKFFKSNISNQSDNMNWTRTFFAQTETGHPNTQTIDILFGMGNILSHALDLLLNFDLKQIELSHIFFKFRSGRLVFNFEEKKIRIIRPINKWHVLIEPWHSRQISISFFVFSWFHSLRINRKTVDIYFVEENQKSAL